MFLTILRLFWHLSIVKVFLLLCLAKFLELIFYLHVWHMMCFDLPGSFLWDCRCLWKIDLLGNFRLGLHREHQYYFLSKFAMPSATFISYELLLNQTLLLLSKKTAWWWCFRNEVFSIFSCVWVYFVGNSKAKTMVVFTPSLFLSLFPFLSKIVRFLMYYYYFDTVY